MNNYKKVTDEIVPGLLVSVTQSSGSVMHDNIGKIQADVIDLSENKVRNTLKLDRAFDIQPSQYYADLMVKAQFELDTQREPYAWRICYGHPIYVEEKEAYRMHKTLSTINKKMEKYPSNSFAQYMIQFAEIIKANKILFRIDTSMTSNLSEMEFKTYMVNQQIDIADKLSELIQNI